MCKVWKKEAKFGKRQKEVKKVTEVIYVFLHKIYIFKIIWTFGNLEEKKNAKNTTKILFLLVVEMSWVCF